jgi:hypothetical protein
MKDLIIYLSSVLGKQYKIRPYKWDSSIDKRLLEYDPVIIDLFGVEYLLASVKDPLIGIDQLKEHIGLLEIESSLRVILYYGTLKAKARQVLIESMIPFIVLKSQFFLPRYYISLRELFPKTLEKVKVFSPADQLVYLYLFYQPIRSFTGAYLSKVLNYSSMTLSRSLLRLESLGLLGVKGIKTAKSYRRIDLKAYYEHAKPYLIDPIQSLVKVPRFHPVLNRLPLSGLKVFERYSGVDKADTLNVFAIGHTAYNDAKRPKIQDSVEYGSDHVLVEVWKYAPNLIAHDGIVDSLSLILSLRDKYDIHVQRLLDTLEEQLFNDYM